MKSLRLTNIVKVDIFRGDSSALQTHQGNCPKEIVWCENKCGARLQRQYLSNHMNNECHKRTLPCRYCHKKFVYETLQVGTPGKNGA